MLFRSKSQKLRMSRKKKQPGRARRFLVSELFATFEAAAFQDEATGMGGVSLHETMLDLTLALMRLVSTFRHGSNNILYF